MIDSIVPLEIPVYDHARPDIIDNSPLRQQTIPVKDLLDPQVLHFAECLKKSAVTALGISANQVLHRFNNCRICYIRLRSSVNYHVPPEQEFETMMFNPQIIRHGDQTSEDSESCVSIEIAGKYGMERAWATRIPRWDSITVAYQTVEQHGGKLQIIEKSITAEHNSTVPSVLPRLLQHEIADHLEGILFTDRSRGEVLPVSAAGKKPPSNRK